MLIEELDRHRHNLEDVKRLLSMAVGQPTPERLRQLVEEFYAEDKRTIFVAIKDNKAIGIIGMIHTDWPHGVIAHLAVHPDIRKQGIGRQLIDNTFSILELQDIEAQTDQDVIDFYRLCGFEIQEIESQYPEVQRFRCVKNTLAGKD